MPKKTQEEIGDEDVDVPDYFYKILVKENGNTLDVLGFVMPNKEQNKPLRNFVVPVDKIEQLTGINFFEKLDKKQQEFLEKAVNLKNWKF